jgi:Dual specificity phosphatase, catalytic domain
VTGACHPGGRVIGVSTLDSRVLLGDAGLAMAMVAAGAQRLVDLRGETRPPRLPVPIDHFPIMDLEPDQDELIAQAAAHVAALARAGTMVGVYCQAGISRTAAVAIAYLLLGGATLDAATAAVRRVRPQAMPAFELMRSLERLAGRAGTPGELPTEGITHDRLLAVRGGAGRPRHDPPVHPAGGHAA